MVEASAYDHEHLIAPRDLWPTHRSKELKAWLDSRDEQRETKRKQGGQR